MYLFKHNYLSIKNAVINPKQHLKDYICIILMFCFMLNGYSATWWVRPLRAWAPDQDGTSKANAYNDLNTIDWDLVLPGDEIVLTHTGDEYEPYFQREINIQASGTLALPVTVRSEYPEDPETIVVNNVPWPDGTSWKHTFRTLEDNNIHDIIIKDIKIRNCYGMHLVNVTNVLIQNIETYHTYHGILVDGPHHVTIENCTVDYAHNAGIWFRGGPTGGDHGIIRNCHVAHTAEGIGVHASTDGNSYQLEEDFKFLNNIVSYTYEEGFDLTSGEDVLVQGNETHHNSRAATTFHRIKNVTYTRNYSHDEPGIILGNLTYPNVTVKYNIFDTKGDSNAITVSGQGGYKISNNIFRNDSTSYCEPVVFIASADVPNVEFKNNIFITSNASGFLLRTYASDFYENNITFDHNLWWHPSGNTANTFKDWFGDKLEYNFSVFQQKDGVDDTLFVNPAFVNGSLNFSEIADFYLGSSSAAIASGISTNDYVDFMFNPIKDGVDIGALEVDYAPVATICLNFEEEGGNIARDASGNHFDGFLVEEPDYCMGTNGQGIEFDETNYIDCTYDDEILRTNQGAVMFWLKVNDASDTYELINIWETVWQDYFLIRFDSGRIKVYIKTGNVYIVSGYSAAIINDTDFHHVAIFQAGNGVKIYIDGIDAGFTGTNSTLYWTNHIQTLNGFWLGNSNWVGVTRNKLNGVMDSFKFINKPITSNQVYEEYSSY